MTRHDVAGDADADIAGSMDLTGVQERSILTRALAGADEIDAAVAPTPRSLSRRPRPLHVGVALQGFMLWVSIEKLSQTDIGFATTSTACCRTTGAISSTVTSSNAKGAPTTRIRSA